MKKGAPTILHEGEQVRPPKPKKHEPERMCVVTRKRGTEETLMRFVCAPDGLIVPDLKAQLPGRGAWVTATRTHLETAISKGLLVRALKADKHATEDLIKRVDDLLIKQCMGSFGLLRRSGHMVLGATKVEAEIRKGAALFVLHATEAAPDGLHKLLKARRAVRFEGGPAIPAINCFSSEQLGLALGAENVIHAAAIGNRQSKGAFSRLKTMLVFRELWTDKTGDDQLIGTPETGIKKDAAKNALREDGTQ